MASAALLVLLKVIQNDNPSPNFRCGLKVGWTTSSPADTMEARKGEESDWQLRLRTQPPSATRRPARVVRCIKH